MTAGGPRCTAALHKRSRPTSTNRKRRELPVNPGQAQPTSLRRFTPASPAGKTATHVSASTTTKGGAATRHDDDQSMQPSSRETEGANDDDDVFSEMLLIRLRFQFLSIVVSGTKMGLLSELILLIRTLHNSSHNLNLPYASVLKQV